LTWRDLTLLFLYIVKEERLTGACSICGDRQRAGSRGGQ
jgi:hypothetical protein